MLPNIPDMKFGLSQEIEEIRTMIRRWVDDRLAPMADQIDRDNTLPRELWPEMGELGLLGITADEEFGGTGLGYVCLLYTSPSPRDRG